MLTAVDEEGKLDEAGEAFGRGDSTDAAALALQRRQRA
jgi:hypothetical protein